MMRELSVEQYQAIHNYSKTLEEAISKIAREKLSKDSMAVVNHVMVIIDIHRELARIDMEWTKNKKCLDTIRY